MTDEPAYCADVAYQGAPGAFSEEAAWALAGPAARVLACRTLADVATALASGRAASAVIPVWNSIAGEVPEASAIASRACWRVVGWHTMPIVQCLVARPGARMERIRDVRSHPVALAQCRQFFAGHAWLTPRADFDTAGSAAWVARRRTRRQAAVASARAARLWGLDVLEEGIQDTADNRTRFVHLMS